MELPTTQATRNRIEPPLIHVGNGEEMTRETQNEGALLVNLLAVLFRWRWMIVAAVVAGAAVFAGIGMLMPAKYEYRAIMEVGRLYELPFEGRSEAEALVHVFATAPRGFDPGRGIRYIESPEEVAGTIQSIAYQLYRADPAPDGVDPGLRVDLKLDRQFSSRPVNNWRRNETALVDAKLTSKGPAVGAAEFLRDVGEQLVEEHGTVVERHLSMLRDAASRHEMRLSRHADSLRAIERALARLEEEKNGIPERIAKYSQHLSELESARQIATGTEPFQLVVLTDRIRGVESEMNRLRERLVFDLPEKESALYQHLADLMDQSTAIQAKLDSIELARESTTETRIVTLPVEEGTTLPRPITLYAILGALFFGFTCLFIVFVVEFWRANRQAIAGHVD